MSDLRQSLRQKKSVEKPTRVELLAPAGSFEAMRAAINAGADAVYMGGLKFGARAYAENPDEEGIIKAIEYCHLRGKKLYMTVNTLFKNEELYDCLFEFLKPYYEAGLDAVIVQDIGAMRFITEHFPDLPIHISTQATITTADGANELKSRGYNITRVVPARELSLKELKCMRENTELEMEVFIHGALCYCYSGQCLLSSMAGGRSGNRGRCAQPCRRLYETGFLKNNQKKYFLSPKDMCVLPYIYDMIRAGINSFKIEGRMKSPEYCAGVVSIYRQFIDAYYEKSNNGSLPTCRNDGYQNDGYQNGNYQNDICRNKDFMEEKTDELRKLYNRGGFNEGYLLEHNGQDMMSLERPNHSGIEVGSVCGVSGRRADILLFRNVNKGDVLEIRGENGKAVFEYTVGEALVKGSKTSVITMKDRNATMGLKVYMTRDEGLLKTISERYIEKDSKIEIDMCLTAIKGIEAGLTCRCSLGEDGDFEFTCRGNVVEKAVNAPMSSDKLIKQLSKLGETDFEAGAISVKGDEDIFIPVGELNRLRREAVEGMKETILNSMRRCSDTVKYGLDVAEDEKRKSEQQKSFEDYEKGASDVQEKNSLQNCGNSEDGIVLIVSVSNLSQLERVLQHGGAGEIYYNISSFSFEEADRVINTAEQHAAAGCKPRLSFALPYICRENISAELESFCERYKEHSFLARNFETIALLKKLGASYRTDYNIYSMNSLAAEENRVGFTYSPEMTINEIRNVEEQRAAGEMTVYGLQPVMISAQCVYKNVTGGCRKALAAGEKILSTMVENELSLTDEKGFTFKTAQFCAFCYNVIYNSAVTNIMDKADSIKNTAVKRLRVNLTFETAEETGEVLNNLTKLRDGGSYTMPSGIMGMKYTNGHYFREVE